MRLSSLRYLIGEGVRSVRANRQMSIASVGILMACMLLIGTAVLFSLNVNSLMGHVARQNEVVAFVDLDAGQSRIDAVETAIQALPNVTEYQYVSKEEALREQMEQLGEDAELLAGLTGDNPLPASFRIRLKDLELLQKTKEQLEAIPGVYRVNVTADVVAVLLDLSSGVNTAGLILVSILAGVSVIIISNTVKVTIFNRRREINIMKYVGATDAFIRMPFLVEGMVIGLLSALLSFGLLMGGYAYVTQWLGESTATWFLLFYQNLVPIGEVAWIMLGGFACAGMGFGLLGSLFFVGRYLKV